MAFNNTSQAENCSLDNLPIELTATCFSLVLLAVFITAANATVIFLFYRRERLRTFTNLCLASLALTDACEGFMAIPLVISCSLSCGVYHACLVMDLCQRFLALSTIAHLFIITTERYIAILQPMMYPRSVTEKRVYNALALAWLTSLSLSLIQLSWINSKNIRDTSPNLIYDYFCVAFIVIPMLAFMVIVHARIILVAKSHRRSLKFQSGYMNPSRMRAKFLWRKKGSCVYVAMVVLYVLGWVPYFLFTIEADSPGVDFGIPGSFRTAFLFLKFSASLFNPLLYAFFKNDFKAEIKRIIGIKTGRR